MKLLAILLTALLLAACGTEIDINDDQLTVRTTVGISERMFEAGRINIGDNDPVMRDVDEATIDDGRVTLVGDVVCDDGSTERGTIAFTVSTTEDNFLTVALVSVDAPCLATHDDRVQTLNDDLAAGLAQAARDIEEGDAELDFTEVTAEDGTLTLSIEFRAPL